MRWGDASLISCSHKPESEAEMNAYRHRNGWDMMWKWQCAEIYILIHVVIYFKHVSRAQS